MTRIVPSGTVRPSDDGVDLIVTRTYPAPVEVVWASITESDRAARWFGRWSGDGRPGGTITVRMTAEPDDAPESRATIDACDPPTHLALTIVAAMGTWALDVRLAGDGEDRTTLTLTHHLADPAMVGDFGPGWEYYLDRLGASIGGSSMPVFEDYHPALVTHFTDQLD